MMELYLANCRHFLDEDDLSVTQQRFPGSNEWAEIYNLITTNTILVDRSQDIVLPYRFKLAEFNRLPTDLTNFDMSYADCCDKRACELIAKSKRLNLPIYVFYSGGIDSTLMLVALLKNLDPKDYDRIVVVMSLDSIRENPNFYYNHIRGKLQITSSDRMSMLFDKSCIILAGEHNDQLFGTDVISEFSRQFNFQLIHEIYTREIVTDFFIKVGMTESGANIWFDLLDNHAKNAPCEIKTIFDFFWWLNFNFKWQSVFFRMLLRVDFDARKHVDQEFVETYFHHFYSEDYFQKWSMINMNLKIKDNWSTYKWLAKDYIFDYTRDEIYRTEKQKAPSLFKLFLQKDTPIALTTDYKYLYEVDPTEIYVPNNSFVR